MTNDPHPSDHSKSPTIQPTFHVAHGKQAHALTASHASSARVLPANRRRSRDPNVAPIGPQSCGGFSGQVSMPAMLNLAAGGAPGVKVVHVVFSVPICASPRGVSASVEKTGIAVPSELMVA
jgi:hypothetical protein